MQNSVTGAAGRPQTAPGLARIVEAWLALPEPIRRAVLTLVRSVEEA